MVSRTPAAKSASTLPRHLDELPLTPNSRRQLSKSSTGLAGQALNRWKDSFTAVFRWALFI